MSKLYDQSLWSNELDWKVETEPISPVAERMNLDKIGNKLVYGSSEAEWCPETHNKNPPINSLGKIFYKQKFKMAAKMPM